MIVEEKRRELLPWGCGVVKIRGGDRETLGRHSLQSFVQSARFSGVAALRQPMVRLSRPCLEYGCLTRPYGNSEVAAA